MDRLNIDFDFPLGSVLEMFAERLLQVGAAANHGAYIVRVLAVLGPLGGGRLGIPAFKRLCEFTGRLFDGVAVGQSIVRIRFIPWALGSDIWRSHMITIC